MDNSVWFLRKEILNLLLKWQQSESLTSDHIPLSFIKRIAHIANCSLDYIFNLSFIRAEAPSRCVHSIITPIPKKPPYNVSTSFRPSNITSIFARLFEKILKKLIVEHLKKYSILLANQHGFQIGKSTMTAIIQALDHWTRDLEDGGNVGDIYFDFGKAFDRVLHNKLLSKTSKRLLASIHA